MLLCTFQALYFHAWTLFKYLGMIQSSQCLLWALLESLSSVLASHTLEPNVCLVVFPLVNRRFGVRLLWMS